MAKNMTNNQSKTNIFNILSRFIMIAILFSLQGREFNVAAVAVALQNIAASPEWNNFKSLPSAEFNRKIASLIFWTLLGGFFAYRIYFDF